MVGNRHSCRQPVHKLQTTKELRKCIKYESRTEFCRTNQSIVFIDVGQIGRMFSVNH